MTVMLMATCAAGTGMGMTNVTALVAAQGAVPFQHLGVATVHGHAVPHHRRRPHPEHHGQHPAATHERRLHRHRRGPEGVGARVRASKAPEPPRTSSTPATAAR